MEISTQHRKNNSGIYKIIITDGDGFEIDMNGIEYEEYLSDITGYKIDGGRLYRVK